MKNQGAREGSTAVAQQRNHGRLPHTTVQRSILVSWKFYKVLSNPAVSERWRLLEAQHLRKVTIKDLILEQDAAAWSELLLELLAFADMLQQKQLSLTSSVLQVMIMAFSCFVDVQSLSLGIVSTIVASFSSVVASAPCFCAQDSIEFLRASKLPKKRSVVPHAG